MGGRPQDFIWTTWAGVFLISDRVRQLLEEEQITGWLTYAVELTDRQEGALSGYFGFAVTGRCGPFLPKKSEVVIKPPPVPGGRSAAHRRGLFFDPSTWDGSDIFCSEDGTGFVVATKRVVELVDRSRITNVAFETLADYETLIVDRSSLP